VTDSSFPARRAGMLALPEPDIPMLPSTATLDAVRERIHRDIDPHIQILLRPHGHQVILDLIQVPYGARDSR